VALVFAGDFAAATNAFVFTPFVGTAIGTAFTFGFASVTGFFLGFGTGFLGATGFAFVFDTFVGRTRFAFLTAFVGTAFVDTACFAFRARFVSTTDCVFRFGFVPLTGLAGSKTGDFAGTGYDTSLERVSIAAVSSSSVISPST
jgi:hypothetical protein